MPFALELLQTDASAGALERALHQSGLLHGHGEVDGAVQEKHRHANVPRVLARGRRANSSAVSAQVSDTIAPDAVRDAIIVPLVFLETQHADEVTDSGPGDDRLVEIRGDEPSRQCRVAAVACTVDHDAIGSREAGPHDVVNGVRHIVLHATRPLPMSCLDEHVSVTAGPPKVWLQYQPALRGEGLSNRIELQLVALLRPAMRHHDHRQGSGEARRAPEICRDERVVTRADSAYFNVV